MPEILYPVVHSVTISPDLENLALGRCFVTQAAKEAGFDEARVFDVSVASSEAMANAIEHAPVKDDIHVTALLFADRLEIQVEGPGEFQAPNRLKGRSHRGLGLPLMAKLADHLALYSGPHGGTLVKLTFYKETARAGQAECLPPSVRQLMEGNGLVVQIAESMPVGICVLDAGLCFRWTNAACKAFLGDASALDLVGRTLQDVLPGFPATDLAALRNVAEQGVPLVIEELELHHASRGTTYWRCQNLPFPAEHEDGPFYILGIVSDVTELVQQRKEALAKNDQSTRYVLDNAPAAVAEIDLEGLGKLGFEAEQARQLSELRALYESAPVGLALLDRDLRYLRVNERLAEMNGLSVADHLGRTIHEVIPSVAGQLAETIGPIFETGEPVIDLEITGETPARPGEQRDWLGQWLPVKDERGQVQAVTAIVLELTGCTKAERKRRALLDEQRLPNEELAAANEELAAVNESLRQVNDALRSSEKKYQELIEAHPDILWEVDAAGRFTYCSPQVKRLWGIEPEELIGHPASDFLSTSEAAKLTDWFLRMARSPVPFRRLETASTNRRGERVFVQSSGNPIFTADGRFAGYRGTSTDVTAQQQAAEELARSEMYLREAQRIAHVGNWELDLATGENRAESAECRRMFGLEPNEPFPTFAKARGRLFSKEEWNRLKNEALQRLSRTGVGFELDLQIKRKDGGQIWACLRGEAVRDAKGQIVAVRGIQDITERKRREDNLAVLADIAEELSKVSTCEEIIEAVGNRLSNYMGISRCVFAQIDQAGDTMMVQHSWDHTGKHLDAKPFPLSGFATRKLLRKARARRTIVIGDARADGRVVAAAYAAWGVRSQVAVPFHRDGQWRYLLTVDATKPRTWRDDEIELIEQVALHTFPRLERARVEEALRRSEEKYRLLAAENERLYRQQLDIAESLQLTLLHVPSEIGRLKLGHLYRSASEAARVGGDFYDVFDVKDGNIAVLIGDVAGHGIQAARTATLVKDVVHAFTHGSVRPSEVLRRTNHLLIEKALPGFVSVFLGILDSDGGRLRYSSAGHPAAFLRRTTGEILTLGSGSHPLGVYTDSVWRPSEVELEIGDVLLLYTDGVIETRRGEEFFGEERLLRLLKRKRTSVFRLPHLILEQVLAFSDGALKDDVAILALSLTEPRQPLPEKPFHQERMLL